MNAQSPPDDLFALLQAEAKARAHLCTCNGRGLRVMIEPTDMTDEQRVEFHEEVAAVRAAACKVHPERPRLICVRFVSVGEMAG